MADGSVRGDLRPFGMARNGPVLALAVYVADLGLNAPSILQLLFPHLFELEVVAALSAYPFLMHLPGIGVDVGVLQSQIEAAARGSELDSEQVSRVISRVCGECALRGLIPMRHHLAWNAELPAGLYVLVLALSPVPELEVTADVGAWIAVIILGVVQVGLAYVFFSKGIKKTSALLACLTSTIEPILNPLWVTLAGLWGILPVLEIPGLFALIGGVIIILTVVGYNIWVERTLQYTDAPVCIESEQNNITDID